MTKTKAEKRKMIAKRTTCPAKSEAAKKTATKKITVEKLEKYLDITGRAIKKVKITRSGKINWKESAEDFFDMAKRYHSDANYFMKKGDYVNAFAAVNYAHGWLDAGARLGMFDVDHDNTLFTVD